MFFYIDNENNLIKSSIELTSNLLLPITEEHYNAELAKRFNEEVKQ